MKKILEQQISNIKLSSYELKYIDEISKKTIESTKARLSKLKIEATVFVGGSLAKGTLIRKKDYDIDLFVRFNKRYSEDEIKKYFNKLFNWFFKIPGERIKITKVYGSRKYVKIILKSNPHIIIEVVPTSSVSNTEKARNITDLSYFHINYVNKKIKVLNKKITDEILLAKSFCHAQGCYGAESYIQGFSGYCLELLVLHYKTFKKLLEELAYTNQKIIIDSEKQYKNKEDILKNLNSSKKQSPIILIDPTFKERNVATALSKETFTKFQKSARLFLESPSLEFFERKKISDKELKQKAKLSNYKISLVEIKTNKQPGDIAGTKLLKFSKFLIRDVKKVFDVSESHFEYDGIKRAKIYFIYSQKKERIILGPDLKREQAVKNFKKEHPIWYIEDPHIKCALPTDITFKDYLKNFKKKNKKSIWQMSIRKINLI